MKIISAAIVLAATTVSTVSASDTSILRRGDRNLGSGTGTGGSKSGTGGSVEPGTLTSLGGDCVYDFPDESSLEVLSSAAAMECVGTRCNPELRKNTVVGVNLKELKGEKKLVGEFFVNCPSKFASFGVGCPAGYDVEIIKGISFTKSFGFVDCTLSPLDPEFTSFNNYCIVDKFSLFDTQTKVKYFCVENTKFLDLNWDA